MEFYRVTFLLIIFITFINSCHGIHAGINVPEFFEQRCSAENGFVTENFVNWSANLSIGTPLYFPILSKLDVLRITQDIFKVTDLNFLTADDVLNSCIILRLSQQPEFKATFTGYCGESGSKVLTSTGAPKVFQWKKVFSAGVGGVFRVSLSDNRSWQVIDVCWGDGQRSFAVISLYPYLSACTRRVIIEHVKAIGFTEDYFTGLTYDPKICRICRRFNVPRYTNVSSSLGISPLLDPATSPYLLY